MVALQADAIKVAINGTRTGGEEWSTGFWAVVATAGTAPSPATLNTLALDILTLFRNGWNTTFIGLASSSTLPTNARVSWYRSGVLGAEVVGAASLTFSAGTSTTTHPYQVAAVTTLLTPIAGRSGRGRMYLPLDGIGMAPAGQYSASAPPAISGAMKTFINAVNTRLQSFAASSAVAVASHTTGELHPVTQIKVDSIPDIQRRRVNQLVAVTTAFDTIP